jgi:DNA end-binding protein Ku
MAARAMWKGTLEIPGAPIGVKLYSAIEGKETIGFRLLHEKDRTPVEGRMVNPETGKPVPGAETKRGYVTDTGEIVVLEREELEELAPEASRDIELLRFVPRDAVDHRWYDRPYYLGPDGDKGMYAALAKALEDEGVVGIARWVMRKKEYVGALLPEGGWVMLVTLRRAGEVIDASALEAPSGRELSAKEVQMAEQLLRALEGEFDPSEWKDEHRERLMELIEAKAKGKTIPIARGRKKKPADDLDEALRKSLAAMQKKSA